MTLTELAKGCKKASFQIMNMNTEDKNRILNQIIINLKVNIPFILEANKKDIETAKIHKMDEGRIDRMMLNEERMQSILEGVKLVIGLGDPIGSVETCGTLNNGLKLSQMRVALGVVGMIYEARPNVSVDAACLCLKAGNAIMLRGSKDILQTNIELVKAMRSAIKRCGYDENMITLLEDTSRSTASTFMKLNQYLDVLIPRGGASLIQNTLKEATVPVLETGTGNCHVYVDDDADLNQAISIIINAKTSRTSVCNACESVLLHSSLSDDFIKDLINELLKHKVLIHGDEHICSYNTSLIPASDDDYYKEYLGLEISIKMVDNLDEAITHINQYGTHHSETIVSLNQNHIQTFLRQVDSACVYSNASTRFSDGFEFGLGAEIGISTQKLHARGPMGLKALTSLKYIIIGNGQIR
ncbi:MAG: glutamate-5-semialdehyde dehydrogenase [Erysipelotrichaceae bacterium]